MSDNEPTIVAFLCNWCTFTAADLAGTSRLSYPPNVKIVRMMCSGMVDPKYIIKAFLEGADGVMIGGCWPGDCHYINGNLKARRRVALLTEILKLMGIEASVESLLSEELAEEGQPPPPVLNITGDDLGILIGRRGETLRALQYVVRLMVSHQLKHWTNLVVDVENYRVRRRRTLENLANRIAEDVARTGRSRALEPMPAYDRRLVHIALRNHPRVATQSVGEGEKRRVTIVPKP